MGNKHTHYVISNGIIYSMANRLKPYCELRIKEPIKDMFVSEKGFPILQTEDNFYLVTKTYDYPLVDFKPKQKDVMRKLDVLQYSSHRDAISIRYTEGVTSLVGGRRKNETYCFSFRRMSDNKLIHFVSCDSMCSETSGIFVETGVTAFA